MSVPRVALVHALRASLDPSDALEVPVLSPNEAMVEEAVRAATPIALLATFAPTLASMEREFEAEATRQGRSVHVTSVHAPGALQALQVGDAARHDGLVVEAASRLVGLHHVALAQFSMARAADAVAAATGHVVLTTPDSAVAKLRRLFEA